MTESSRTAPMSHDDLNGASCDASNRLNDLSVDEFCLETAGSHGRRLYFTTDDGDVYDQRPGLLEQAGTVVVRIGVDFIHDQVAIDDQNGSRIGLVTAAIADLQAVLETLAAVTPTTAAEGRCTGTDDEGRCKQADGHAGGCADGREATAA